MSLDGQTLAEVKNRLTKSQLDSELYKIEKDQKEPMRLQNSVKQRFRAKYSKLDIYNDEASDVKSYETDTPGFCYHRNGERKIQPISSPSTSIDYDDIRSLLFTNDEVDIEKVLCLHLLTAHKTETLTPPSRYHRTISFLAKDQSPLERLIERSKGKKRDDENYNSNNRNVTKLLPTYVLDVKSENSFGGEIFNDKKEVPIKDGRLGAGVIINDRIVQLVHTVMSALGDTNPDKMNELLKMANDLDTIKQVVEKPNIQDFLNDLNGQLLLSSCESFHFMQPCKTAAIPLELETKSVGLKRLVSHIRTSVLQSFPVQSTWKTMYKKSQVRETNELPTRRTPKKDTFSLMSREIPAQSKTVPAPRKNFISQNKENVSKRTTITNKTSRPTTSTNKHTPNRSSNNSRDFVPKNLYANYMNFLDPPDSGFFRATLPSRNESRKVNDQFKSSTFLSSISSLTDEMSVNDAGLLRHMDIRNLSRILSHKTDMAVQRNLAKLKEDTRNVDTIKNQPDKLQNNQEEDATPVKFSIKQTKCVACIEKWRTPLPRPKIPKLRKIPIPILDQTVNDARMESPRKLSQLIDRELEILKADVKRPSRIVSRRSSRISESSNRSHKSMAKSSNVVRQSADSVDLDALDLARIAQEIKEHETQKKLDKFMEEQL